MAKSLNNKSQKESIMEFKKEDIVIVDEKKTNIFEKKEPEVAYPCDNDGVVKRECSKRWMESLSDCA